MSTAAASNTADTRLLRADDAGTLTNHLPVLPHAPQDLPSPAEMHELAAAWRPYASLGSYFMWKVEAPRGGGSGGGGKKRKAK